MLSDSELEASNGDKSGQTQSSIDTKSKEPVNELNETNTSELKEQGKPIRERRLALKARENKILELTQQLITTVHKQLEQNESFLDRADTLPNEEVDSFMLSLDTCMHSVNDTFEQIKTLAENKVSTSTQTLFNQFNTETQLVHAYYSQRKEEDEELIQAERALTDAKIKLEQEMQQLEARMTARHIRLQQKLDRGTEDESTAQHADQANHEPAHSVAEPTLPQQRPESSTQPAVSEQQNQTNQNQPPQPDAVWKTSGSVTAEALPNGRHTTFMQESHTDKLQTSNLAHEITEHMHISLLSPPEPSIFTGDPLEYADWRISFDSLIDSKRGSPLEKLHRLKKYVDKDAKEAISGYFRLQTVDAYKEALETLHEEFGRDDLVENSFRDTLEQWPRIANKDHDALKKYSYFLRQCLAAQRAMPNLQALNDKRENKKFIKVLPTWLINRWTYFVTDQEERKGFPPFSKYVEFVAHEARVSTNNLRDTNSHRDVEETKPSSKPVAKREKPVRNLNSSTSTPSNCLFCNKGPHPVAECRSLAAKSETEKSSFVKEHRLCFGCLRPGHTSKDCRSRAECSKCKKPHPTVLHRYQKATSDVPCKSDTSQTKEPTDKRNNEVKSVHTIKQGEGTNLLSMILPVYVSSGDKKMLVYALLDTQSDASFITSSVANQIKPCHTSEQITMTTLHGETTQVINRYDIKIKGYNLEDAREIEVRAYEQDNIPCNRNQIPNIKHVSKMSHLKHILTNFPPELDIPIGILLGVDCTVALTPLEVILGEEGETFALRTVLGWTLCGQIGHNRQAHVIHNTQLNIPKENEYTTMSQNDLRFVEILERGFAKTADGSICLPLPFKEEPIVPNNKVQAEKRFQQLVRKLKGDQSYKLEYQAFMKDLISNQHAEIAPTTAAKNQVWYIPHFGVRHPKKKKLRVVFDASARYNDKCLNDLLLTGPDQMNSLIGILLRFRKQPIAISCDVEKMFHNFHVLPEHRDFLRFLWTENDDMKDCKEYRMTRHLFGATSSPGVATFALRKIAKEHMTEMPKASSFIINDFYVDDGITSVGSVEEAVSLVADTREICRKANLHLHKFLSNNREVLATIPASERVKQAQNLDLFQDKLPTERTLGLEWSVNTDTIRFHNNMKPMPQTRRGILSVTSQLYDPLGLLAPFTLQGRLISQKACQETGEWDAEVSAPLKAEWKSWTDSLNQLNCININRCLKPKDFGTLKRAQLHHFCDASLSGYGACSYLKLVDQDDNIHVSLLMAKARVAPLKAITIPRLELQSAVEAIRLSTVIKSELDMPINDEYFWSDSMIALGYIKNSEARFHMFVANRVQEIRQNSTPMQWHHVQGKTNPADLLSRGCALHYLHSSTWWDGPKFLHNLDITGHLEDKTNYLATTDNDPEIKRAKAVLGTRTTTTDSLTPCFAKFSSWPKLVKAIATVKNILKNRSWKKPRLTSEDLLQAEQIIVRIGQENSWHEEVKQLSKSQVVSQGSSILQLTPFLDKNGLLRVGGRVKKSLALSDQEKHPLIISKTSPVAKLLVSHSHKRVYHQGHTTTLGAIRSAGYWIVGVNRIVKNYIDKCVLCKAIRGQPLTQLMGDLPQERVEPTAPFTHIGIDCFGPYTVKDRRTELKRWGLLITCMYSRAVHIELLESMTTDALINALRCLICIRGSVRTIYCDNGTNFVGAYNELNREWETKETMQDERIDFKFNAPGASHAGGTWERQIKTVKSVLSGMLVTYKGRMNTESLRAAFFEAMNVVNNRPLTIDNLNKPGEIIVTPNHLITMKPRQAPILPGKFDNQEIYGRKMWRKVQMFAEEFWKEWKTRYITDITKRQKWKYHKRTLRNGDLVMIVEESLPRNQWPLAIVEEAIPGSDGLPRKAKIRVATRYLTKEGKKFEKATRLERPIQKLVLLLPVNE